MALLKKQLNYVFCILIVGYLENKYGSNDPLDLAGPPYMVAEHIFGEYDLDGCDATKDEIPG